MKRILLYTIILISLFNTCALAQVCPTVCQTLAAVINALPLASTVTSTNRVPVTQSSSITSYEPLSFLITPTIANLTSLRASCTALGSSCPSGSPYFTNGVVLLNNGVTGSVPLFYLPGSAACATDDGYTCIDSNDDKDWLLQLGSAPSVITASGSINLTSQQVNVLWQPSSPTNSTITLPATPVINETHSFKDQTSGAVYLEIAGNTGQTIDSNPYWILNGQNDSFTIKWTGSGSAGNWAVVR